MKKILIPIMCLAAMNLQGEKVTYTNRLKKNLELQIQPKSDPDKVLSVKLTPDQSLTIDIPDRTIEKLTFVEYTGDWNSKKNKIEVWSRDKSKQNTTMNMDGVNKYEVSKGLLGFKLEGF